MDIIESMNTSNYYAYLDKFSNTICGRRPIGVFLNVSILLNTPVSSSILVYSAVTV